MGDSGRDQSWRRLTKASAQPVLEGDDDRIMPALLAGVYFVFFSLIALSFVFGFSRAGGLTMTQAEKDPLPR